MLSSKAYEYALQHVKREHGNAGANSPFGA